MKEGKKVAGGLTRSAIDPLNLMSDKTVDKLDPSGIYKPKGNGAGAVAAPAGPAVMPDADSEAVAAARRRKMAAMRNRGGRASTVLGGEDRLGG